MRFRTRCEAIRAPGREFSIWPSAAPSHSQSVHQFRVLDAESGAIHTEGQLETLDRFFSEANAKDLPEVAMAESTPPSGAMEGRGAYDRHAELPASGGAFALPHFERAVRTLPLDTGDQPIVIADYGSSQGKNSLAPMRIAIEALRRRRGPDRPIVVYHVDLPANDFNALFETLQDDPERYVLNQPNVFPCAIGRSFYESVLPPGGVHIGWSSYAAM